MPFVEDNYVIKQVSSTTSNPALRNTVLPRTPEGNASWLASDIPHRWNHIGSKLWVPVEQQESMGLLVGPRVSQLLCNPESIRISRHIEAENPSSVVADNEKAVQNTKRERWDSKEVHRSNGLTMIPEESQPSFRGIWISRCSPNPSRDTPFGEIEPQLEQLAVNARRSPGWILGNHTEDQGANLFADALTSSHLSGSWDPCPIQTKPSSMPAHDGSRSN
jgi:hypothetical protein